MQSSIQVQSSSFAYLKTMAVSRNPALVRWIDCSSIIFSAVTLKNRCSTLRRAYYVLFRFVFYKWYIILIPKAQCT